jgi:hypothetical protein
MSSVRSGSKKPEGGHKEKRARTMADKPGAIKLRPDPRITIGAGETTRQVTDLFTACAENPERDARDPAMQGRQLIVRASAASFRPAGAPNKYLWSLTITLGLLSDAERDMNNSASFFS